MKNIALHKLQVPEKTPKQKTEFCHVDVGKDLTKDEGVKTT